MNLPPHEQRQLSLGFRTEMIFHRFDGTVLDRGDYLVVKTPSNPGFFFGNLLLFFQAPRLGTLEKWKKLFRKEFEDLPEVKHLTFLWDSPSEGIGDVTELGMEGFKVDFSVVLTARSVLEPKKSNPRVEVRPISTDREWRGIEPCLNKAWAIGLGHTWMAVLWAILEFIETEHWGGFNQLKPIQNIEDRVSADD